jgi:hypothetical protein
MAAANPGKFNQKRIDEAMMQWNTEGTLPEGGLLIPAWRNPEEQFRQYASTYHKGATYKPTGQAVEQPDGTFKQEYAYTYPAAVDNPDPDIANRFQQDRFQSANLLGWFAENVRDTNPEEWERWMKEAGNDEIRASQMWFNSIRPPAYNQSAYETTSRARSEASQGLHHVNSALFDGKNRLYSPQKDLPVVDGRMDNAIVFEQSESRKHVAALPAQGENSVLLLPKGMIVNAPSVNATAYAADRDKTYWKVDKRSLDQVRYTDDFSEALDNNVWKKDPATGQWKIREGFDADVMIATRTADAAAFINGWTGNEFSSDVRKLPQADEAIDLTNL